MKYFFKMRTLIYALLSLMVLAGCTNILSPPQSTEKAGKGITITVVTDDENSRTLYPDYSIADYTKFVLSFTGPEGATRPDITLTSGQSSATVNDLAAGAWTVKAVGYVDIKGTEYAAAEGSSAFTVNYNSPQNLDITISASQSGEDGFFSYDIDLSSASPYKAVLKIGLYPSGTVETRNLITDPSGTIELPPGYYRMQIMLFEENRIAEWTEIVHIYSNMETKASRAFDSAIFINAIIPLTEGVWMDDEITYTNGEKWYSINVTAGTSYYVWWDDNLTGTAGSFQKTLDVMVRALYEDGSTYAFGSSANEGIDPGWSTASTFTPAAAGTVYVRVVPYYPADETRNKGTYGIVYATVNERPPVTWYPPADPVPLTAGVWADNEITTSGEMHWYSFPVTEGASYRVWWNERNYTNTALTHGDGTRLTDISWRGFYDDGSTVPSPNGYTGAEGSDNGFEGGQVKTFTSEKTGMFYIRTIQAGTFRLGTYGIVYDVGNFTPNADIIATRPRTQYAMPGTGVTELSADTWVNSEIAVNINPVNTLEAVDEVTQWYSVSASAPFNIWWNDGAQGSGTKTGDVYVYAYDAAGVEIFSFVNNGWTTPQEIDPGSGGKVYIRVQPYFMTPVYGTYSIVYSAGSTRPVIPQPPDALIGRWAEPYSEYTITATELSTGTDWGGYAGTIVNHRDDGPGAGYITIQFTANDSDPSAVDKYYVIHYENLTATDVDISGAYLGSDPDFAGSLGGGKATQVLAESTYTVANGYFVMHTNIYKRTSSATFPGIAIMGSWTDEMDIITITDDTVKVVADWGMGYLLTYFIAEIVNERNEGGDNNFITFRYLGTEDWMGVTANPGDYGVLYWTDYGTGTVEIAISGLYPYEGQASQALAESTYDADYFDGNTDEYDKL